MMLSWMAFRPEARKDDPTPRLDRNAAESIVKELTAVFFPPDPAHVTPSESINGAEIEVRYQTLVEQIPAIIFMAMLEDGIGKVYVSPHIETALGFTQEEWINDPVRWYYQIHPEDRDRWSVEGAELFLTGRPLRSVYRVLARDGHVVWFHCHAKMVRRAGGRPWFIHGVAFDITDVKQAEEGVRRAHEELDLRVRQRTSELARANAELQTEIQERKRAQMELTEKAEQLAHANTELEQFAYSTSHDLQEPIRNLAIYSQLLARRYQDKLDADANEIITFLVEGAQRMSLLIRDLLAYTKVNAVEAADPVDANAVLRNVLAGLRTVIAENRATITYDSLPAVRVPAFHLQLLFQNLVLNGIKYRGEDDPRVHIGCSAVEGGHLFSVEDNGIGIAPEYHERIFGIFKRLHTADKYPGTGIGLAICRRIVMRFGGRIWVESQPGAGAKFCFTLPPAIPAERQ